MPLVQTRGAASAQGFGEFAQVTAVNYIEDVFSTFLYTGNGSTQTITNGIDLSTKGGLTWTKSRTTVDGHGLVDTARGGTELLQSQSAGAQSALAATTFLTTGYDLGNAQGRLNGSGTDYVSWTFRKQAKFFDIVTYTGDGNTNQTIPHDLGSTPGCIIVKGADDTNGWYTYHRGLTTPNNYNVYLNSDVGQVDQGSNVWNVTSTTFQANQPNLDSNKLGITYVAYIFAHDAGGFGLTGTENVISCGSFTAPVQTTFNISLGYEPQFLLVKKSSGFGDWYLIDVMRGFNSFANAGPQNKILKPNSSGSEGNEEYYRPTATGIQGWHLASADYIYIAIRRGPMKVPTSGTSVFGLNARTGTGAVATVTGGQTDDAVIVKNRGSAVASLFSSRLTGTGYLVTSSTAAEVTAGTTILQANPWDVMDGVKVGTTSTITNASANTYINYLFKRAPGFMDIVCYTGTGSPYLPLPHNLTVVPQMIIGKFRNSAGQFYVYHEALGATNELYFNSNAVNVVAPWTLTSTTFQYDTLQINTLTYVTYLFATCAGVSKVGSYTGTGALQTVNCGFTTGARFILIKRSDSTGDWYFWDSARGISAGDDPYLLINSSNAEVINTNYVDTDTTGFQVTAAAPAALNASGGNYIFLAIA